eukprot:5225826-Pleurochrysis_carterae.AAC.3
MWLAPAVDALRHRFMPTHAPGIHAGLGVRRARFNGISTTSERRCAHDSWFLVGEHFVGRNGGIRRPFSMSVACNMTCSQNVV